MNIRYAPLRMKWAPLAIEGETENVVRSTDRLRRILRSWEDTPYMAGQGYKGVGADCVRATVAIMAEWIRWAKPDFTTLPPDAALHNRQGAIRALITILRSLPSHHRVRGPAKVVYPGDVLITGHTNGGPGHAVIVGTEKNTLWQATQTAGFLKCGWALPPEFCRVYAVMRFRDLSGSF
tara:strand:+ start:36382 stop:36918 length:537 start_codon:yes stop_codon:yes gene_type:complete